MFTQRSSTQVVPSQVLPVGHGDPQPVSTHVPSLHTLPVSQVTPAHDPTQV
jgi:hypothetical protein